MNVSWDGPEPIDDATCPYPIYFECRPAPADTLNSLEAGRLLIEVSLGGGVKSVSARITNNAKMKHLENVEGASDLKHRTTLLARLVPDGRRPGRWTGGLGIPSSWIEGGTRTYERTGAASPKSEKGLYTLEMKYEFEDHTCTARFSSEDAFHWQARQKAAM